MTSVNVVTALSSWLLYAAFGCVAIATIVVLIRLTRGPSMLDRAISMDVVTAAMIGAVAIYSAMTGRLDLIAALVALSVVGFIGTTTIARFAVIDDPEEARIMNEQEAAEKARIEQLLADDDAPVHDIDSPREPS